MVLTLGPRAEVLSDRDFGALGCQLHPSDEPL
jgi:hypothetical protein